MRETSDPAKDLWNAFLARGLVSEHRSQLSTHHILYRPHPSPSLEYTLASSPPHAPEARGRGGVCAQGGEGGQGGVAVGREGRGRCRGKAGGDWWRGGAVLVGPGGLVGGGAAVLTYYRAMVEAEPAAARRAMLGRHGCSTAEPNPNPDHNPTPNPSLTRTRTLTPTLTPNANP